MPISNNDQRSHHQISSPLSRKAVLAGGLRYVDAAGRNSKHVFAGTTRIATKLEMPSHGGGGFEKFQYFYHPDHLGSTSYVTDQLGEVDQHYETFAFGESWIEEATGQADKVTPYRFTAKEWDSETQLYYFGARYYDPRTSLWTAPDPALASYLASKPKNTAPNLATDWKAHLDVPGMGGVFEPRNLNLASYVHQNPLKLVDPDGKEPVSIAIAIVVGVAYVGDKAYAAYEGYQDYKAIKSGEKTAGEVIQDRAIEQGAGLAAGPLGRWGVKGGKWLKRMWHGNPCNSFAADTLVATKDGLKRIDQVKVDELVLSRNDETGETSYKNVTQTFSDDHPSTIRLRIRKAGSNAEEELLSSYGHPIFVENAGWTLAGNLKAGDRIVTSDGSGVAEVVSQSIESEPLEAYNFEVADHHSYFVGEIGAWVHNGSPCDKVRDAVQGSYVDPRTNKTVATTDRLAADHILPAKDIKKLPGFDKLTKEQQDAVLNYEPNFQGLPGPFNSSKGAKSGSEWLTVKGEATDPAYREALQKAQDQYKGELQQLINNHLKQ